MAGLNHSCPKGASSSLPPTSRQQLLTSHLPWVLETRCSISQGRGREQEAGCWRGVRFFLTPYMFLLPGWLAVAVGRGQ